MIFSRICIEVFGFGFFGFRGWKKYQNVCLIFAAEIVAMDCFWGASVLTLYRVHRLGYFEHTSQFFLWDELKAASRPLIQSLKKRFQRFKSQY